MKRLALAILRQIRSAPAVSLLVHGSLVVGMFFVAGIAGPGADRIRETLLASNPEHHEPAPEIEEPPATEPRVPRLPQEESLEEPPPIEPEVFTTDDPPPLIHSGIGLPPSEKCTSKPIVSRRPRQVKPVGPVGPEPGPKPTPREKRYEPPRPYHQPKPESDRRGVVVLDIEVLRDGSVGQIVVAVSSGISRLDRTAVRAAKRWKFHPATEDGVPVVRWARIRILFE